MAPPVYVRKEIVHNKHVVTTLEKRGAIFVDETDEVPEGATVVFSAHGVAPVVHEEAAALSLKTIDATCPLVTKVHREAVRFADEDYDILLIGHEGHEEVVGTSGEAPEHITLVDGPDDVANVDGPRPREGRLALADHALGRRDHGDGAAPRPDPRAGRAREQPQGRQRRAAQAAAHRVHRRVRLGQELAGLRHDRRRVQRMINETYSAFVQGFMPSLARPDVDLLEGLTTAIIVDQERMGANPRSTVGTATDANAMLRILFSRLGEPHIGSPRRSRSTSPSISGAGVTSHEKGGRVEGAARVLRHRRACARAARAWARSATST
jgi:hypothetical protein